MSRSKRPPSSLAEEVVVHREDPRAEPESILPPPEEHSKTRLRVDPVDDRKDERAAGMRQKVAQLHAQLIEVQKELAAELQGRAEDAERVEELEAALERAHAEAAAVRARETAARASLEEAARAARVTFEEKLKVATETERELRGRIGRLEEQAAALRITLVEREAEVENLSRAVEASRAELEDAKSTCDRRTAEATQAMQAAEEHATRTRSLESALGALLRLESEAAAARAHAATLVRPASADVPPPAFTGPSMGAAGSPPPLPKRRPLTFSEPAIDITQLLDAGQVEMIDGEPRD